jgi:hypothetical protein
MSLETVGLWIDHSRAVILFPGSLTAHLVESRSQDPGRYYDHVIEVLGAPRPLLIMGPGRAKDELRERMARVVTRRREAGEWVVEVEAADAMTTPEIVATLSSRLGS